MSKAAVRYESMWHAADGSPVAEGDPAAVTVEIVSYDEDGNEVERIYGDVDKEPGA